MVGVDEQKCIVKLDTNYYFLNHDEYKVYFSDFKLYDMGTIQDSPILAFFMLSTIIFTIVVYFCNFNYKLYDNNFIYANIVLILNIAIHECGHALILKGFRKESKIKIGFKIYFIYPAFYVDTSDSYFLPKYKRIAVYLAGNFFNCIYILLTCLFMPSIVKYNYVLISTILINFLPIIKSDGYYTIKAFFGKYNFDMSKKIKFIDDTVRGMIMFILLYVISKI
ncbi:hypothetical protein [Anaerococcus sp. AGMB09787]|uniref:hypothetical protein n=1 Tax=Anaerococcus sp. AGMB09787 TaxID=2922869 RepID=UPI001FAECA78|nr:hypothetical protein [Anaerococcus sp. AGMB09787]